MSQVLRKSLKNSISYVVNNSGVQVELSVSRIRNTNENDYLFAIVNNLLVIVNNLYLIDFESC